MQELNFEEKKKNTLDAIRKILIDEMPKETFLSGATVTVDLKRGEYWVHGRGNARRAHI